MLKEKKLSAKKVNYIVGDLIPENMITLLIGKPGSFKNWLMAHLAVTAADGRQHYYFLLAFPSNTQWLKSTENSSQFSDSNKQLLLAPNRVRYHLVEGLKMKALPT